MAKAKTIELGIKFDSNGKEILGLAIDSKQLAETIASVNKQSKNFQQNMSNWGFFAEGLDETVGRDSRCGNAVGFFAETYGHFQPHISDQCHRSLVLLRKKSIGVYSNAFSLRFLADSNCCKRFCRPAPNHSAKEPFRGFVVQR